LVRQDYTMKPVGLSAPAVAEKIVPPASVVLEQPRLRAVLQRTAHAVADTPPALHTSVRRIAASRKRIVRMAPPGSGHARPGPDSFACLRRLRHALLAPPQYHVHFAMLAGGTVDCPPSHQQSLDAAAAAFIAGGVTLAGGAAHVWQLPVDAAQPYHPRHWRLASSIRPNETGHRSATWSTAIVHRHLPGCAEGYRASGSRVTGQPACWCASSCCRVCNYYLYFRTSTEPDSCGLAG